MKSPLVLDVLPQWSKSLVLGCTWPVRSFDRLYVTLARRDADGNLNKSLAGLENFIAGMNEEKYQILSDSKGRKLKAKIFEVIMLEDQIDVTFEFNPNDWKYPT